MLESEKVVDSNFSYLDNSGLGSYQFKRGLPTGAFIRRVQAKSADTTVKVNPKQLVFVLAMWAVGVAAFALPVFVREVTCGQKKN